MTHPNDMESQNKDRWLYISDYDSHAKCVEHGQRLRAEGCRDLTDLNQKRKIRGNFLKGSRWSTSAHGYY